MLRHLGSGFAEQLRSSQLPFSLLPIHAATLLLSADFNDPGSFIPGGEPHSPSFWISFGPIWLFAPFLDHLARVYPQRLKCLRGVIACSSSSVITKRFASNRFDRELVARLTSAEDQVLATCRDLHLPSLILRPTLIYGRVGPYVDQNLSRLIGLMRTTICRFLCTLLRQPIHASQLAAVMELVRQFTISGWDPYLNVLLSVVTVNFATPPCCRHCSSLFPKRIRHRCRLLSLPTRLFYTAAFPLLLQSPKAFEAVLRMGSDLSGFTPAHELLKVKPQPFPVLPLL